MALAAILILIGYAVFIRPFANKSASPRSALGARPVPVSVEPVGKADLNVRLVALGTVTPLSTVTVHSRVDGQLQKIFFEEGKTIEAGEPLADIDPRPFEAQKLQTEAQAGRDQALLDNARIDLERYRVLIGQDSVSKQQVDTQEALVRQYEATLKLDQAQLVNASLQLAYAHITAPTSGRVGLRLIDVGNIVHASDASGIVVITQLHPISVVFSLPQSALPKVQERLQTNEPMTVEAYDRDGRTLLATGKLATIDNQIDLTTGTVKMRAEFENTNNSLFPNQFVNIQLLAEKIAGATVIPSTAIQSSSAGSFVYVIVDQKASVRSIETGPTDHGLTAITKGLAPGDMVVVDGVDKLREGSNVELVQPAGSTSPARPAGKRPREGGKPQQGKQSTSPTS
jgi:multidrug efflux system membrane fusion protein